VASPENCYDFSARRDPLASSPSASYSGGGVRPDGYNEGFRLWDRAVTAIVNPPGWVLAPASIAAGRRVLECGRLLAASLRCAGIALVLLAAGCSGWEDDLRQLVSTEDVTTMNDADVERHPTNEPVPPQPPTVPTTKPTQPAHDSASAMLEKGPADPDDLIGLNERAVESILGAPGVKRDVPPAKIWQYSVIDCVVSVYFYLNLESQDFQALRYEIVPRPGAPVDGKECYAQLEARQREAKNYDG
jgi:hypothetical protein